MRTAVLMTAAVFLAAISIAMGYPIQKAAAAVIMFVAVVAGLSSLIAPSVKDHESCQAPSASEASASDAPDFYDPEGGAA